MDSFNFLFGLDNFSKKKNQNVTRNFRFQAKFQLVYIFSCCSWCSCFVKNAISLLKFVR